MTNKVILIVDIAFYAVILTLLIILIIKKRKNKDKD